MGLDVGDENCAQTNEHCKRSSSQRYKDRVNKLRQQSKETYQREQIAFLGPSYFTQVENNKLSDHEEDDEFDIFERAGEQMYSQRSR